MVTRRVPSVICKRAAISGRFLLTGGDCVRKSGLLANFPGKTGRGGEIRTHDLLYPKQARYQATLRPAKAGENAGGQVQLQSSFSAVEFAVFCRAGRQFSVESDSRLVLSNPALS